jgi:hypothetical protein
MAGGAAIVLVAGGAAAAFGASLCKSKGKATTGGGTDLLAVDGLLGANSIPLDTISVVVPASVVVVPTPLTPSAFSNVEQQPAEADPPPLTTAPPSPEAGADDVSAEPGPASSPSISPSGETPDGPDAKPSSLQAALQDLW